MNIIKHLEMQELHFEGVSWMTRNCQVYLVKSTNYIVLRLLKQLMDNTNKVSHICMYRVH